MADFEYKTWCYNRLHSMPCSECLRLIQARHDAKGTPEQRGDYYTVDVGYLLTVVASLKKSVDGCVDESWERNPGGPS